MPAQRGGEVNQRGVADRMAVPVVDGLEAIQVDHRAAGRHSHRAVAGPPVAGAPESATVQERREIVLVEQVLRLFQRPLQTRDALHIAFTLIANARNCLDNGERDPVLAEQWHEAAQRFMQDYNANLDVYTGSGNE